MSEGPERSDVRVLVVDDDSSVLAGVTRALERARFDVTPFRSSSLALEMLSTRHTEVDVALLDVRMPGVDGLQLLALLRAHLPTVQVVMMTGSATIDCAVEAMKLGAYDYLTKPFGARSRLLEVVSRAADYKRLLEKGSDLADRLDLGERFDGLLGESQAIMALCDEIDRVSRTRLDVQIVGERGTEVEAVARAIHAAGRGAPHPFLALDCGARTDADLERDLFASGGLVHEVGDGTLFLDDVGELCTGSRARLVDALAIRQAGSHFRLVTATCYELDPLVEAGALEPGFLAALGSARVAVPPLRSRREDIPLLVHYFARTYAAQLGRPAPPVDAAALERFCAHDWPGNTRELESAVRRGIDRADGAAVTLQHLPAPLRYRAPSLRPGAPGGSD